MALHQHLSVHKQGGVRRKAGLAAVVAARRQHNMPY